MSIVTKSTVEFGVIPKDHWYQPDWIDEQKATSARNRMAAANVKYGGMLDHSPLPRLTNIELRERLVCAHGS